MKKFFLLGMLLWATSLCAQTNFTSRITNPSFESNFTGWTYSNMQTQTNSVFDIKAGTVYVEKWTSKGSAVGSCSVSQAITRLQPGNYELTVAAQNIQEDTPNAAQTGAYIFAGDQQTTVTVRNNYKVAFDFVTGSVEIGFKAVNASGNWIAVDNFRLVKVGDDLSTALASVITQAQTTLGDGTGRQAEQLQQAISDAETVAANTEATAQEQADAIVALQEAEGVYQRANASEDHPLDLTSLIINPSFETGNFTGWTQQSLSLQTNNVFNIKQGTYYAEKWVSIGSAVGDASIKQTITGLYPGRYRLTVAAQNIQENSASAAQTGAYIFANTNTLAVTTRKQYVLDFVLSGNELEIGFRAEGAKGNWLALDNFRLQYLSDSQDDIRAAFEQQIADATALAEERMNSRALSALENAITQAQTALDEGTEASDWAEASSALEAAYTSAQESVAVFKQLEEAIAAAQQEIAENEDRDTDAYMEAVEAAMNVYDEPSTTDAQALAAVNALAKAAFAFKVANGTGAAPTVVTDKRFIKGATWAFGRSTVTGSNILEEGFCWSESPDPKVTDNRTTEFINQAGKIYWLRDLKPGTMYYMRAYAITKNYAVGYGDVIKFSTVPKGTIGTVYNKSGDEVIDQRISTALDRAMNYYWNNLSSIHDITINVNYSPGTPTADCSYGGWMRMGANTSYQRIGTIMHESLHGIGVGTHNMWWNGDMRSNGDRGDWLGDRVTEAVRFWDNNTTGVITGDNTHLWPYGCNGANEDNGSDNLYVMMGIIAQALNEDGLPGSSNIGYALPYYSYTHEDGVKYYIKNEDENYGLRTSYLVENDQHNLVWQTMSAEEAVENDAAAWYLTFSPSNQYYQLKNAKSGYYMTYNSTGTNGIRTVRRTTPQTNDNFHLMRGRVDVTSGPVTHRGYYIIHPQSNTASPTLLSPASNGQTSTAGFSILRSAKSQRWLILTADEARNFDSGGLESAKEELEDMIARIRTMSETPHTENVEGADNQLDVTLQSLQDQKDAATTVSEVRNLMTDARSAGMDFLGNVSASSLSQPFDLTFLITNPDFKTDGTSGWTAPTTGFGYDVSCVEYFQATFDFYQILADMPIGTYELHAQAFQRPGAADAVYTPWANGTARVTTSLYINSTSEAVKNICDDAQTSPLYTVSGWGTDVQLGNNKWVPDCMTGSSRYFARSLYDNSVEADQTNRGNLRIGIKCTSSSSSYWTIFDNFRLYYYGNKEIATDITSIQADEETAEGTNKVIYDLSGRRIDNSSRLQKGIYIVNGKKIHIR